MSPSGRIDAIFYDRRIDPENVGTDVYYTHSSDGGRTFTRNQRVSELAFSSKVGPRYFVTSARGLIEFGARLALVSDDSTALAAWTDSTNSRRGVKAQDIMATEIAFPAAPGRSIWLLSVAAALVVAGSLAMLQIGRAWTGDRQRR